MDLAHPSNSYPIGDSTGCAVLKAFAGNVVDQVTHAA
jgi:hypothetical protein